MKKILLFVVSLFILLPFVVKADSVIIPVCSDPDANGIRTCTIQINSDTLLNTLTFGITEYGGALVLDDSFKSLSTEYTINEPVQVNNVWTVELTAPVGETGEGLDIFEFKYKVSGTEDCKIGLTFAGNNYTIEEEVDEPGDDKQTGFTVPYIALGSIAILSIAVYLGTKNKSKMYKI